MAARLRAASRADRNLPRRAAKAAAPRRVAAPAVSTDPSGQLRYVETELQAAAGQPFSVQFDNPSPLPHNWVLVSQGEEEAVAGAAQADGSAEGVDGVVAGGAIVAAGQSAAIDVPAVEAGAYSYICTVPGHYAAGMRGTLNVR